MKIGEVARRLRVTTDVVRYAANNHSDHMSASAGGQHKGVRRQFTTQDCQVIATILKLREQGLSADQIELALKTTDLEPCPDLPDPGEQAARESIALVAQPEYERALDRISQLEHDLQVAKHERGQALETWQSDVTRLTDKIAELEHELGLAKGQLMALEKEYHPSLWWFWRGFIVLWLIVAVIVFLALILPRI